MKHVFLVTVSHPNQPDQEMEVHADSPVKAGRGAIAAALSEGLQHPVIREIRDLGEAA